MIISQKGIAFIKEFESCKLTAYKDIAGIWTIGYGTTRYSSGIPVTEGNVITQDLAESFLKLDIARIELKLEELLDRDLLQHEYDAVVSFCYNVGMNGFKVSTLLRRLNDNLPITEPNFTDWNKTHKDGKLIPSNGLTRRREEEYRMFKGE